MVTSFPIRTVPDSQYAFQDPQRVTIQAWAQGASEATTTSTSQVPSSIQSRGTRGSSVKLEIPLDGTHSLSAKAAAEDSVESKPLRISDGVDKGARELVRRDSLKRREALLKGKEGSRRRQRWENDRLLSNPWAQPPLPSDWEPRPTYPRRVIPYFLAPLWDAELAARKEADAEASRRRRRHQSNNNPKNHNSSPPTDEAVGRVPKELRAKLKRAKGAKNLLQDLEEEVRRFVLSWERKQQGREKEGLGDADSEEDEIVFVGHGGRMHDLPPSPKTQRGRYSDAGTVLDVAREKLVFEGMADDRGASFGRWLVHSLATYYGLRTWSRTVGDPARREAYVGIKSVSAPSKRSPVLVTEGEVGLPRPLWVLV